jgi:hypothetical protein
MSLRACFLAAATALTLAGCATVPLEETADRRAAPQAIALPPMKAFGAPVAAPIVRSRTALAADFLDLTFLMESGRPVARLTRFEGPVRVGVRAARLPATLERDLEVLLARLRREAGIDIRRAQAGETPNLVIEALPRARLQRAVPQAACFVVPNVASWDGYMANRRSRIVDWTDLDTRRAAAVFLPDDVSPQEVRDCLNEEIAQALGPLNDLYRLEGSVFNDDNFHMQLTQFDMLMLRLTYAPELANGMSRAEVAQRLPALLSRYAADRPVGDRRDIERPAPRAWIDAVETALGPGTSPARRITAARDAVRIAESAGLTGVRRGFAYYVLGRLSLARDPELALASFLTAGTIFRDTPGTGIHRAHVAAQLAAFALSAGDGGAALRLVTDALPAVMEAQNASLLATLLMMKAEALTLEGRPSEAQAVRLDSLGWARYGFGTEAEIGARLREIAAVTPERRGS